MSDIVALVQARERCQPYDELSRHRQLGRLGRKRSLDSVYGDHDQPGHADGTAASAPQAPAIRNRSLARLIKRLARRGCLDPPPPTSLPAPDTQAAPAPGSAAASTFTSDDTAAVDDLLRPAKGLSVGAEAPYDDEDDDVSMQREQDEDVVMEEEEEEEQPEGQGRQEAAVVHGASERADVHPSGTGNGIANGTGDTNASTEGVKVHRHQPLATPSHVSSLSPSASSTLANALPESVPVAGTTGGQKAPAPAPAPRPRTPAPVLAPASAPFINSTPIAGTTAGQKAPAPAPRPRAPPPVPAPVSVPSTKFTTTAGATAGQKAPTPRPRVPAPAPALVSAPSLKPTPIAGATAGQKAPTLRPRVPGPVPGPGPASTSATAPALAPARAPEHVPPSATTTSITDSLQRFSMAKASAQARFAAANGSRNSSAGADDVLVRDKDSSPDPITVVSRPNRPSTSTSLSGTHATTKAKATVHVNANANIKASLPKSRPHVASGKTACSVSSAVGVQPVVPRIAMPNTGSGSNGTGLSRPQPRPKGPGEAPTSRAPDVRPVKQTTSSTVSGSNGASLSQSQPRPRAADEASSARMPDARPVKHTTSTTISGSNAASLSQSQPRPKSTGDAPSSRAVDIRPNKQTTSTLKVGSGSNGAGVAQSRPQAHPTSQPPPRPKATADPSAVRASADRPINHTTSALKTGSGSDSASASHSHSKSQPRLQSQLQSRPKGTAEASSSRAPDVRPVKQSASTLKTGPVSKGAGMSQSQSRPKGTGDEPSPRSQDVRPIKHTTSTVKTGSGPNGTGNVPAPPKSTAATSSFSGTHDVLSTKQTTPMLKTGSGSSGAGVAQPQSQPRSQAQSPSQPRPKGTGDASTSQSVKHGSSTLKTGSGSNGSRTVQGRPKGTADASSPRVRDVRSPKYTLTPTKVSGGSAGPRTPQGRSVDKVDSSSFHAPLGPHGDRPRKRKHADSATAKQHGSPSAKRPQARTLEHADRSTSRSTDPLNGISSQSSVDASRALPSSHRTTIQKQSNSVQSQKLVDTTHLNRGAPITPKKAHDSPSSKTPHRRQNSITDQSPVRAEDALFPAANGRATGPTPAAVTAEPEDSHPQDASSEADYLERYRQDSEEDDDGEYTEGKARGRSTSKPNTLTPEGLRRNALIKFVRENPSYDSQIPVYPSIDAVSSEALYGHHFHVPQAEGPPSSNADSTDYSTPPASSYRQIEPMGAFIISKYSILPKSRFNPPRTGKPRCYEVARAMVPLLDPRVKFSQFNTLGHAYSWEDTIHDFAETFIDACDLRKENDPYKIGADSLPPKEQHKPPHGFCRGGGLKRYTRFNVLDGIKHSALGNMVDPPPFFRKRRIGGGIVGDVQKQVIMSQAVSFTDSHIDFTGASNVISNLVGEKHIVLIRSTQENQEKFFRGESSAFPFSHSGAGTTADVVEMVAGGGTVQGLLENIFAPEDIFHVRLKAGDTLVMSAGMIHTILTVTDSICVGTNQLLMPEIPIYCRIAMLEAEAKLRRHYRWPDFDALARVGLAIFIHHIEMDRKAVAMKMLAGYLPATVSYLIKPADNREAKTLWHQAAIGVIEKYGVIAEGANQARRAVASTTSGFKHRWDVDDSTLAVGKDWREAWRDMSEDYILTAYSEHIKKERDTILSSSTALGNRSSRSMTKIANQPFI